MYKNWRNFHFSSKHLQEDAFKRNGGPKRDRTADLLNANQALSQLSYGPLLRGVVGLVRFELTTPPLSRVCSNQLSYKPVHHTK